MKKIWGCPSKCRNNKHNAYRRTRWQQLYHYNGNKFANGWANTMLCPLSRPSNSECVRRVLVESSVPVLAMCGFDLLCGQSVSATPTSQPFDFPTKEPVKLFHPVRVGQVALREQCKFGAPSKSLAPAYMVCVGYYKRCRILGSLCRVRIYC